MGRELCCRLRIDRPVRCYRRLSLLFFGWSGTAALIFVFAPVVLPTAGRYRFQDDPETTVNQLGLTSYRNIWHPPRAA